MFLSFGNILYTVQVEPAAEPTQKMHLEMMLLSQNGSRNMVLMIEHSLKG